MTSKSDKKLDDDLMMKFKRPSEQRAALHLRDKYTRDYIIETVSDKNNLNTLIFLEIVQARIQNQINSTYENPATREMIALKVLEALHKNQDAISKLKDKLGMSRDLQDGKSRFDIIKSLTKKIKVYNQNNQASRTYLCKHCGKFNLLKIKIDQYEAQEHPFFKDRWLGNAELVKLYQKGFKVQCPKCKKSFFAKITKDIVAKILQTSTDYVDWLVKKWHKLG